MIDYNEGSGRQYHTNLNCDEIGKYIILPGDPGRCEKIAKYFDDGKFIMSSREYTTYTGYLNGTKVSVVSTGMGGPSAAIGLEELTNLGAHTFIRVGTSGGMQVDVKSGDLVIASGAIRMEGTSKEYAPIEFPAVTDFDVTTALANSAKKLGFNYHVGVVQCKDAFFGQHQPELLPNSAELINKWNAWLKMGTLCSEMETAALAIVAAYRKVKFGSILLVVANQERAKQGLDNPIVHDTDGAIKVAIEALKQIIEEDNKK